MEILNQIPEGVWLAIHSAIVVPLAMLANKYLKVGGLWFNYISSKQIVAWAIAVLVGYSGWATSIGALTDDAWYVVAAKSFLAGLAANGWFDAIKRKS
jgi:hypothetical protein